MKRKILLLVLVVFLISILAGCGPHFIDGEDEEDFIEQIVYDYWMAIMNRQYELAKYDCIPGGVYDHKTDELEELINANSEGDSLVMIYFTYPYFTRKTEIIGDTAFVYVYVAIHKIPFPDSDGVINIGSGEYVMELIRETPPLGWMLK